MIAFEVSVNGRRICRAGVGRSGVLTAIVNWVGGSPRSPHKGGRTRKGEAWINVGGLYSLRGKGHVHPRWLHRVLMPGDEVLVHVLQARRVDPPKWKEVNTNASIRKQQRAYYLAMKKKFERQGKGKAGQRAGRAKRTGA